MCFSRLKSQINSISNGKRAQRASHPSMNDFSFQFSRLADLVNANCSEILIVGGKVSLSRLNEAIVFEVSRRKTLRRLFDSTGNTGQENRHTISPQIGVIEQEVSSHAEAELRALLVANIWENSVPVHRMHGIKAFCIAFRNLTVLQFVTSHLLSDARAGYELTADVVDSYNKLSDGIKLQAANIESWNGDLELRLSSLDHIRYFSIAAIRILRDFVTFERGTTMSKFVPSARDILKHVFARNTLALVLRKRMELGVTLHPILLTAAVKAWAIHKFGRDKIEGSYRIADMYSFRRYASSDNQNAYDTMVMPFFPRIKLREDVAQTVLQLQRALDKEKHGRIFAELYRQRLYRIANQVLPKNFAIQLALRCIAKTELIITNAGTIELGHTRFGNVEIVDFFSFPQLFPPGRMMIIFNTFADELRATIVYDAQRFARSEIIKLVELMEQELQLIGDDSCRQIGAAIAANDPVEPQPRR